MNDTDALTSYIKTDTGIPISKDIIFEKSGVWPKGIDLDQNTGVISGIPTEIGDFKDLSIKFSAKTPDGEFFLTGTSNVFQINIDEIPTKLELKNYLIPSSYTTVVVGENWSINPTLISNIYTDNGIQVTSGINFSVEGNLPSGYEIDKNTGIISGTASSSFDPVTLKIKFDATVKGFNLSGKSDEITIKSIKKIPTSVVFEDGFSLENILTSENIYVETKKLREHVVLEQNLLDYLNFYTDNDSEDALSKVGLELDHYSGVISGFTTHFITTTQIFINFSISFHDKIIKNEKNYSFNLRVNL